MTEHHSYNEIDDYISELTEPERERLATADTAIELAFLFHRARMTRGLTQAEAAEQTGVRQQAVSRFEQPDVKLANTKIDTLRKYLAALDYSVQIVLKDLRSGVAATHISLPPRQSGALQVNQAFPGNVQVSPSSTTTTDHESNTESDTGKIQPNNRNPINAAQETAA